MSISTTQKSKSQIIKAIMKLQGLVVTHCNLRDKTQVVTESPARIESLFHTPYRPEESRHFMVRITRYDMLLSRPAHPQLMYDLFYRSRSLRRLLRKRGSCSTFLTPMERSCKASMRMTLCMYVRCLFVRISATLIDVLQLGDFHAMAPFGLLYSCNSPGEALL